MIIETSLFRLFPYDVNYRSVISTLLLVFVASRAWRVWKGLQVRDLLQYPD